MNKISLYSSFPYWLQNVAVSLHGYKLKRQRFNDDFYKILDFLNSTQGWSKEQIRSYKEEHTFKILEQAYNHCPYYRKKYANVGLSPSDFKRLEDLRKFPILTKEEIRENWQGMVADNVSKEDLILYHTSGSTGKALDFYWTKHSSAYYWAVDQRYKNRFGFELGKTCVNFTGHPIVPITTSKPPYWRFDRVLNRYFLNMQQLNAHTIHTIAEWLNTKRMEIFIGYPSIMTAFANEMLQAGLTLEFPPKHIFTGAEKLYENQKDILWKVYRGVLFHELYSFSEQAAIATHCTQSVYHEDFEIGHMELNMAMPVANGLQGEILATGFANLGMPFIRYQNGDTAVFSGRECECGLHSQIIEDIVGRNEDYIVTPEGLHIQRLDYIFKDSSDIKECQVVQKASGEMILRIVKRDSYDVETERKLLVNISQFVSPSIKVKFEYVDEIPRTKAGKFKAVVSELKK